MHSPTDFKIHRAQSSVVGIRQRTARPVTPLTIRRLKAMMLIFLICVVNTFFLSQHLGSIIASESKHIDTMLIARSHANDENISLRAQRAKILSRVEIEKRAAQEFALTIKAQQHTRTIRLR